MSARRDGFELDHSAWPEHIRNGIREPEPMTPQERYNAEDVYFGGCPECGSTDGYINTGKSHWFFCKRHKTRWCVGSNLFSSWKGETEAEQRDKASFMYDFNTGGVLRPGWREVEPLIPDRFKEPVEPHAPSEDIVLTLYKYGQHDVLAKNGLTVEDLRAKAEKTYWDTNCDAEAADRLVIEWLRSLAVETMD